MLKPQNLKVVSVFLLTGIAAFSNVTLLAQEKAFAEEFFNTKEESVESLPILNETTLISSAPPLQNKQYVLRKIEVIVTAYSSTPWETDEEEFITASGNWVRDGIVANNLLSFGTKVRFPALFKDKIFVVDDRMHPRKGYYHVDIWFPSHQQAEEFGVKFTEMEILAETD